MRYQRELCVVAREVSEDVVVEVTGDDVILDVVVAETLAVAMAMVSWTCDCLDLAMMFCVCMCWCGDVMR